MLGPSHLLNIYISKQSFRRPYWLMFEIESDPVRNGKNVCLIWGPISKFDLQVTLTRAMLAAYQDCEKIAHFSWSGAQPRLGASLVALRCAVGLVFINATHDMEWSSSEWSRDDTPIGIAVVINSARKCLNLKIASQPASNVVRTDVREWTVGCFVDGRSGWCTGRLWSTKGAQRQREHITWVHAGVIAVTFESIVSLRALKCSSWFWVFGCYSQLEKVSKSCISTGSMQHYAHGEIVRRVRKMSGAFKQANAVSTVLYRSCGRAHGIALHTEGGSVPSLFRGTTCSVVSCNSAQDFGSNVFEAINDLGRTTMKSSGLHGPRLFFLSRAQTGKLLFGIQLHHLLWYIASAPGDGVVASSPLQDTRSCDDTCVIMVPGHHKFDAALN